MQGSLLVTILHFLLSCYSGLFFKQKYITMYSYRERQTTTRNICLVTPLNITIRHSNSVPVQYTFSIFRTPSQLIRYKFNNLVHLFSTIHLFGTLSRYIHSVYLFGKSILQLHLVHLFCTPIQFEQIYLVRFLSTIMQYQYSVRLFCTIRLFVTPIHYIYLVNLFGA